MLLTKFLNNLFKKDGFLLEDANGHTHTIGKPESAKPIIMKIHDKKLHSKLLFYPDLYIGEAYTDGKITFKNGNISVFLDLALKNIGREKTNFISEFINSIRGSYRYLTNFNFIKKSKMNVAHHYDISDELYFLFLDPLKQYSCAYFKNESESLEDAQKNKINHIIKKLNIKENSKVLDIGSGWGHLSMEIARQAKCQVTGVTLSENQYRYSSVKAKESNLGNQVQFKLMDYREVKEKYDRVVSVGMFEHVGRKFYNTFFNKVSEILKDDGLALLHTIGSVNAPRSPQPWITKYIFPGGYTPSLSEVANPIEKSGLILSDMEVLRMHYAHTLRNWKERFIKNKEKVLKMFDERFFRMFEFYLSSCEMAFKHGDQVVYQLQLTKKLNTAPSTRDYIYS
jgi:cyclopropane-fatty-acyl-phospholipid synthase